MDKPNETETRREIKQNEEELQRKHNKLQLTLSAILEKWICYANDEGWLKGLCQAIWYFFLKAKKTFIANIGCCPHNSTERIADFRFVFETHYVKQPPNGLNSFISTDNTPFTSIFVFIVRSVSDYWIDYLY